MQERSLGHLPVSATVAYYMAKHEARLELIVGNVAEMACVDVQNEPPLRRQTYTFETGIEKAFLSERFLGGAIPSWCSLRSVIPNLRVALRETPVGEESIERLLKTVMSLGAVTVVGDLFRKLLVVVQCRDRTIKLLRAMMHCPKEMLSLMRSCLEHVDDQPGDDPWTRAKIVALRDGLNELLAETPG